MIADFSTRVNYFNPDPEPSPPWKKGDAATFEKYWNVPTKTVSPYLIDWDSVNSPGYAVAGDRYRIGNWCQIVDLMAAPSVSPIHWTTPADSSLMYPPGQPHTSDSRCGAASFAGFRYASRAPIPTCRGAPPSSGRNWSGWRRAVEL